MNKTIPGETLQQLRRVLDVTQEQLAQLVGTTRVSVARWESGTTPCASPPLLLIAALEALDRNLLPLRPLQRKTRWEWLAELFSRLHDADAPKPTAEEVLQAILHLDALRGYHGRVPIFHVREHFGDRLSRPELDARLFELVGQDRLRMSTLQEGHLYTREQFDAGIPSVCGGPRFFLIPLVDRRQVP